MPVFFSGMEIFVDAGGTRAEIHVIFTVRMKMDRHTNPGTPCAKPGGRAAPHPPLPPTLKENKYTPQWGAGPW